MKTLGVLLCSIVLTAMILLLSNAPAGDPDTARPRSSNQTYEGGTMIPGDINKTALAKARTRGVRVRADEAYIVIDRYCNRLFLRTRSKVLLDAFCSTGSGGELVDDSSGRRWKFETPSGVFTVNSKLENPWWRKPDWAFVEEDQPIPADESQRLDNEMMGDYAIGFGDGYFVHGTIYERLLGRSVTHGCVRLAAADLKVLYDHVRIGTRVFIY